MGITQEYGKIEFWSYVDEGEGYFSIGENDGEQISLNVSTEGIFQVGDSDIYKISDKDFTGENSVWLKFTIEYECGMGNHYNLPQYHFRIHLNDTDCGEYSFKGTATCLNTIKIKDWTNESVIYLDTIAVYDLEEPIDNKWYLPCSIWINCRRYFKASGRSSYYHRIFCTH